MNQKLGRVRIAYPIINFIFRKLEIHTSMVEIEVPRAENITVTEDTLSSVGYALRTLLNLFQRNVREMVRGAYPTINFIFRKLEIHNSMVEIEVSRAENITVTEDTLSVDLSDGRTISVPLAWYPRLAYASRSERNNWRLIGKGYGIHWEDIGEDISVEGLLAGKPSGESQPSFKRGLASRPSESSWPLRAP